MRFTIPAAMTCALLAPAQPAGAAVPLQRYLLVVGANAGGTDRPQLQYAVSDAERFARVMVDLGGVLPANQIVLRQPKLQDLVNALNTLSARVADGRRIAAAAGGGRTEVILYYSGHADAQGLLLGDDRYSYRSLRDRLDQIPADVRIAVLDACASGAFTRLKGGRPRPPFLVDESSNTRGHAFLTSSAATEAAQESDRIRASYFTHYLLSGFRGAADLSGDGKITLNEAYQFAFSETLGRTVDTKGGAQHPHYEINLSGTGDVVMTDVRQTTATLVLDENVAGRFFVRNASQELVVELYKPAGRAVELGLEPGTYEMRLERDRDSLVTKTQIQDGGRVVLNAAQFGPAALEPARRRGDVAGPEPPRLTLGGRNRVEARVGLSRLSDRRTTTSILGSTSTGDLLAGMRYTRFFGESFAVTAGVQNIAREASATFTSNSIFSGSASVFSVPVGVRWNPVRSLRVGKPIRPFVTAEVMPVVRATTGNFGGENAVFSGSNTETTVGGHLGGGVDLLVTRGFSITVDAGYNWMRDFKTEDLRPNYGGADLMIGFGWQFGRGKTGSR